MAITRPAEVVRALREAAAARAVLITRGGGEGVQLLDDEELIEAVASSPAPVAVALGHATDDLVLGRVADASFPTPTAFGAFLRGCLEEKRRKTQESAEADALTRSQDLLAELARLHRTQATLASWRTTAIVLGLLLAAVIGWPIIRP